MEKKRMVACICAFILAASLIAVDTFPTFAAAASEGPTVMEGQVTPQDGLVNGRVYVNGALYSGYYMASGQKMYSVKKGIQTLKTGAVKSGTKYYSYSERKVRTLSKETLYVKGKVYTGYYQGNKKKMYSVKKGTLTLKTGIIKAKTKYYSYKDKKTKKLSKETLYVKGKAYTGYYQGNKKKMYSVKKGTLTLKTGIVKAKTKYYSYKDKKTKKLSKETLYVKGKVYTGYYLDKKNKMYRVKKGKRTLVNAKFLDVGTKYYSYKAKKTLSLSKKALYVGGQAYTGYYLDRDNKMYSVNAGICTLVNTALNAGTPYYSYSAKKMQTLPALSVYIYGKAAEGMSPESLATLQRAQTFVASVTNDSMTKAEKLKVCFDFLKTYIGNRPRTPHYTGMDWPVVYANDIFVNRTGNCCSRAAAFAYVAKAIGYEEVYCCNNGGHGWAEVDGLIYDPERSIFDPAYSYYAISYDTKTNVNYKGSLAYMKEAWMRVKI